MRGERKYKSLILGLLLATLSIIAVAGGTVFALSRGGGITLAASQAP